LQRKIQHVAKTRCNSCDRQILSSRLADTAEWHEYAAIRDAAEVPAMSQGSPAIHIPFRSSSGPSKLAVGATCGIVACACLSYIAWSLSDWHSGTAESSDEGITLSVSDASEIHLKTPSLAFDQGDDETPLELDNSIETDGLPVINAHLEVPTSIEPQQLRDLPDSHLRQLSHEAATPAGPPADGEGAWLTGTIESPFVDGESSRTISRYLR
jgi:hypothetical protein